MSESFSHESLALASMDARISTARLDLTPLLQQHAEELFWVLSDDALYEYTHDGPPLSLLELRNRYARLESRRSPDGSEVWLNWVLIESLTGVAIGYVQATVDSHRADIAWVVGTLWQRRGFAREAAQAVVAWLRSRGVRIVRAMINPTHTASQKVALSIGLSPTDRMIEGEDVWECRF